MYSNVHIVHSYIKIEFYPAVQAILCIYVFKLFDSANCPMFTCQYLWTSKYVDIYYCI